MLVRFLLLGFSTLSPVSALVEAGAGEAEHDDEDGDDSTSENKILVSIHTTTLLKVL